MRTERTAGRRTCRALLACAALAALACAPPASAAWQPGPPVYEIGTTKNLPIEMRDGIVLRADVFFPVDESGEPAEGPFPVILSETPYGKFQAGGQQFLATGYSPYLIERGYIQVIVDVRGMGASDGTFDLLGPAQTADSVEVIEWASKLPRSTGEVGMTGESYLGEMQLFAAAAVGPDSPLKAIFPMIAGEPYRELFAPGGLINFEADPALGALFTALPFLNPTIGGPHDAALPARLAQHTGVLDEFTLALFGDVARDGDRLYDEAWWRERNPMLGLDRIARNGIPAFIVATLWDIYQAGGPRMYAALQNGWRGRPATAPMEPHQPVTGRYQLLMKRDYHSSYDRGDPDLEPIKLAWFDRWLKDVPTGIDETPTPIHVVLPQQGERLDIARYPAERAPHRRFYLGAGGALTPDPPAAAGEDTLVFTGASLPCDRNFEQSALGIFEVVLDIFKLRNPCAERDLLPQSAGPGQLTYTTPAFSEDMFLAGPVSASLFATTSTPDSEWVVKLSDVAPDGSSVDITQGALLGSHRAIDEDLTWRSPDGAPILPWHPHTRAAKSPVRPGELTRFDVAVRPTFVPLERGHRLKLTLLSSQTPELLAPPVDLPNLLGGVYRVQRNPDAASFLNVPIAPRAAFVNRPPAARAVARRVRGSRDRFRLSARGSADPDGAVASYRWTLRGRTLSRRPTLTRRFTARRRAHRVRLTVTDDLGATAATGVTVRPRRR